MKVWYLRLRKKEKNQKAMAGFFDELIHAVLYIPVLEGAAGGGTNEGLKRV